MEIEKVANFGERFTFPKNVEITINGDTLSTFREAAIRMAERYEDAIIYEIVKEAKAAGYTEVTVLNKQAILDALRKYSIAPKTNADRIRAMSNEELATFLDEVEFRRTLHGPGALWKNLDAVLEWLCQPVEEVPK